MTAVHKLRLEHMDEKYRRRRIYDEVRNRLMDGTGRAMHKDTCMYLGKDGNRCAVGLFIDFDRYPEIVNYRGNVYGLFEEHSKISREWWAFDRLYLHELQRVHDNENFWNGNKHNALGSVFLSWCGHRNGAVDTLRPMARIFHHIVQTTSLPDSPNGVACHGQFHEKHVVSYDSPFVNSLKVAKIKVRGRPDSKKLRAAIVMWLGKSITEKARGFRSFWLSGFEIDKSKTKDEYTIRFVYSINTNVWYNSSLCEHHDGDEEKLLRLRLHTHGFDVLGVKMNS